MYVYLEGRTTGKMPAGQEHSEGLNDELNHREVLNVVIYLEPVASLQDGPDLKLKSKLSKKLIVCTNQSLVHMALHHEIYTFM